MLYPFHLLIAEGSGGWQARRLGLRSWRPTLLVPLQMCLFESVTCAQVHLWELPRFAQIQARRIAPFRRWGGSARLLDGQLLLWVWDSDEVERAIEAAGLKPEGWRLQAESMNLVLPATVGSILELRGSQSVDRLDLSRACLLSSDCLPLDVGVLRPQRPSFESLDWLQFTPKGDVLLDTTALTRAFNGLVWVGVAMGGIFLAHQFGSLQRERLALIAMQSALESRAKEQQTALELETGMQEDQKWLRRYRAAAAEVDFSRLTRALLPVMESNGVVAREVEVSAQLVKIVLASAGGEIQMPALLEALDRVPGLTDVQLLQHNDLNDVTFTFVPSGFLSQGEQNSDRGSSMSGPDGGTPLSGMGR